MRWTIIAILTITYLSVTSQTTLAYLATPTTRLVSSEIEYTRGFREVPIKIERGKILIEASVDGEQGYLILDTGSPGMVINKKPIAGNDEMAFSVSRELQIQTTYVDQLSWGGIDRIGLEALAVDLGHLEASLGHNILGMLGYDMLADLTLIIDFPNQKLLLKPVDQGTILRTWSPKFSVPFELEYHLPVVEAVINGQALRLGVDTGTGSNLMSSELIEGSLASHFTLQDKERLQGLDQQVDLVEAGVMESIQLGGEVIEQPRFLSTDLAPLREATGLNIDGLLGYEFFKNYKCSIDFQSKRIYFW